MTTKQVNYPETLYVILHDNQSPPYYQGRLEKDHLPISGERVRIAEYKLVRQIEVKREVVDYAEVG